MKATIRAMVALIVCAAALAVSTHLTQTTSAPTVLSGSAAAGTYFDYLVIILMENQNECQILTSCGGSANYMTGLANAYGLASADRYCNVNPSLPNYLCLTGGSDFGCKEYDGDPNSNACTAQAWHATNIVDQLTTAGLTWKAYMEDMPSNCYASDAGDYVVRHNPFVYYSVNANDSSRCARIVPAGSSDVALRTDLGSTATASNYMWLTPNKRNDMHSSSISTGDTYLSGLVPKILDSTIFKTTRAALFITFDEGYDQPVYTIWAGPEVKPGYSSSFAYNHFSLLATLESNWNLASLTSNDRDAPNMAEFFVGQASRGVSTPPSGPVSPGLVVGVAAAIGAAVIVGVLLPRRRKGKRGSPPGPPKQSTRTEDDDDDEWEL